MIFDSLFESVHNHNLNKSDRKYYMIEIEGFSKRDDVLQSLKADSSLKYKFMKWKTSISNDGEYIKMNGIIKKQEEFYHTKVNIQSSVSLLGYSLEEENVSIKERNWNDENDGISFKKEKEEDCNFFMNNQLSIFLFDRKCILKFKNSDFEYIKSNTRTLLNLLFINYPFLLTREDEEKVRQNDLFKQLQFLEYKYISEKKNEKAFCLPFYFYSIPCIKFSINKLIYVLDIYDNLRVIGMDDDIEPVHGFLYFNLFVEITEMTSNMLKTDALLYKTEKGFEIYTKPANIYIDDCKDGIFFRKNIVRKQTIINNFLFTKNVMSEEKKREIQLSVHICSIKYIVKKFSKNMDINFLENNLNKKSAIKRIGIFENNFVSSFLYRFLNLKNNEMKPIKIQLLFKENYPFMSFKNLLLEEKLKMEKLVKFSDCEYEKNIHKLLDLFKEHSTNFIQQKVYKKGSITNAWMKCWEMLNVFDLIPKDHSNKFTVFCNAEFPGAFLLSINHYIKTETSNKKYEWYANSLYPEKYKNSDLEIFKDSFGLYEKYPKKWLMNAENEGDITTEKMIKIIEETLSNKVDLYTGDISIGTKENEEEIESKLYIGQLICGLKTLKNGGSLLCKMNSFFKPLTMSLLQLMTKVFDEFYITKPMVSRGNSSEIYIVGKGYNKNENVINVLMKTLVEWNSEKINEYIDKVNVDFYLQLIEALYKIYNRQIYFMQQNMIFVNSLYGKTQNILHLMNKDKRKIKFTLSDSENVEEFEIRKSVVEQWDRMFPVKQLLKEDDL